MLRLIKYEIMRKRKLIIASVAVLIFIELGILFGIYKGDQWSALSIFLIFIMIFSSIIIVFVDTIRSYSFDLNNKQGYSLFLTPTSGYKIIASKALVSLLELITVVFVVFVLMYLNFQFTKFLYFDSVNQLTLDMIQAIKETSFLPTLPQFSLFIAASTFQWFTVIMIAILAMTIRKTILSQSKVGWLISLAFFIALYSLIEVINVTALTSFGLVNDIIKMSNINTDPTYFSSYIFKYVGISAVLYPIYISVLFFLSGFFLNKRVDL